MQLFLHTGDITMAQVALSIRMDEDLKREFGQFCSDIGMSMSTAFVVFAKAALQERQIPFVIGERKAFRRIRQNRLDLAALRAQKAFESIRADVQARDLPELTMEEIDAEIATARRERRERETTARKATRA
jgi:DNA-damage-inducible protein J